jgi:hypothetical protein
VLSYILIICEAWSLFHCTVYSLGPLPIPIEISQIVKALYCTLILAWMIFLLAPFSTALSRWSLLSWRIYTNTTVFKKDNARRVAFDLSATPAASLMVNHGRENCFAWQRQCVLLIQGPSYY